MAVPPNSRSPDVRARRAWAVRALIEMGWRPPVPKTEQTQALLDDMRTMNPLNTLELAPREIQHLRLAATGISEAVMAEALGLSPLTIQSRGKKLRRKLGAKNTTEAVAIAIREGVIE